MIGRTNVGGGVASSAWAYIGVTYPQGSTCTATNGVITLTADGTSGLYVFGVPEPLSTPETWTVSCTDGTKSTSAIVEISAQYQTAVVTLSYTRVPESYQEVEYLEQATSGNAYFHFPDTTSNDANGEYSFSWQPLSIPQNVTYRVFCGAQAALMSSGSGANNLEYYCGSSTIVSRTNTTTKQTVVFNDATTHALIENGTQIGTIPTLTGVESVYFGAVYSGGVYYSTAKMRLFEFIRKDNSGDVVLDAIPCKRISDNVCGFYDTIGETFYQSASGSFIAGPDV